MLRKIAVAVLVFTSIAVLDQVSKAYALKMYALSGSVEISTFCNIVQIWNNGISFGMFGIYENSNTVFSVVAVITILIMAVLLFKLRKISRIIGLSVIMGGALGNLIDRIRFGAVYDFIDIHIGELHWPAFNVADACIVLGVVWLLFQEASTDKVPDDAVHRM